MYLTRIHLNTEKRDTLRALSNPNLIHGALNSAFPGERPKLLWRIDKLDGNFYLLILCSEKNNYEGFCKQFGDDFAAPEIKEYGKLLEKAVTGSIWRFRLAANPTYCEAVKEGEKRGKRHAHKTIEYQQKWLLENSSKFGFEVKPEEFSVVNTRWYSFNKPSGQRVSLLSVTYEGILAVSDEKVFSEALCCGIGREKAYGLGLLTLVKCHA